MQPSTIHAVFQKAGFTIKHMWETRFSDPEVPHLNAKKTVQARDKVSERIDDLPNGYLLLTNYGYIEVRYGISSIMIHYVSDYGHDTNVNMIRILPVPVNMLDTSVIIHTLRMYRESNFGY